MTPPPTDPHRRDQRVVAAGLRQRERVGRGVGGHRQRRPRRTRERGRPGRRRVVVGGRPARRARHAREPAAGPTAGDAEQLGQHRVRGPGVQADRDLGREVPSLGQAPAAGEGRLGVAAPPVGGIDPQSREHPARRRRRGEVLAEVVGQPDDLDRRAEADVDLGEADRGGGRSGRLVGRVDGRDGDAHRRRRLGRRKVDALPVAGERGVVDGDDDGVPVVDLDRHLGDVAAAPGPVGLQERHVVDPLGRLDPQVLAERIGPVGDHPRRGRIAIDGHDRPILGAIRERLAVRAGPGVYGADLDGVGHGGVRSEHVEALVARRRGRTVVAATRPTR